MRAAVIGLFLGGCALLSCAHRSIAPPAPGMTAPQVMSAPDDVVACRGIAIACEAAASCLSQDGCYTDQLGRCTGSARACSLFSSDASCSTQTGCYWTAAK